MMAQLLGIVAHTVMLIRRSKMFSKDRLHEVILIKTNARNMCTATGGFSEKQEKLLDTALAYAVELVYETGVSDGVLMAVRSYGLYRSKE